MPLYHFSDRLDVAVFEPHVTPTSVRDEAYVWAIDDWHAPMYFVPRDCPRACFWPGSSTTAPDRERFFGGVNGRMVIAVESRWLDRIRGATLYRYRMPEEPFALIDATAGHWISREAVRPLGCDRIDDLLGALAASGVELRLTPSLIDLWRAVIASTMEFSGTRLRNAKGWDALAAELRNQPG